MNYMYFAISRHTKGRKGTKRSDVLVFRGASVGYHQYVISYVLPCTPDSEIYCNSTPQISDIRNPQKPASRHGI